MDQRGKVRVIILRLTDYEKDLNSTLNWEKVWFFIIMTAYMDLLLLCQLTNYDLSIYLLAAVASHQLLSTTKKWIKNDAIKFSFLFLFFIFLSLSFVPLFISFSFRLIVLDFLSLYPLICLLLRLGLSTPTT